MDDVLKTAQIQALSSLLLEVQREIIAQRQRADAYEAALQKIAEPASVTVYTTPEGGIQYKRMYRAWRQIAANRVDIARDVLKGFQQDE